MGKFTDEVKKILKVEDNFEKGTYWETWEIIAISEEREEYFTRISRHRGESSDSFWTDFEI